jgi:hypothetical protein
MFTTDPQTLLFGIAKDGVQGWKIQVGKIYLVHRLAYNGDVAAGQLAVFQGDPF